MRNWIFILAGIILIALFFSLPLTGLFTYSDQERALVIRVIDGDTVELENEERVRLLGIDTPERGQVLFDEASDFLKERIEKKEVILKKDVTDKDKYDRLLRYIYIRDTFVNLELVKAGLAKVLIYPPDEEYQEILLQAEALAREKNLGVWQHDDSKFCFAIFYLHYNAAGNDNNNLNDEFVKFRNACKHTISLNNWVLRDRVNKTYTFPDIELAGKELLTLHTGSGQDNETDIYWNNNRAIWNNNGDSLKAWNSDGELMLDYTYGKS